MSIFDNLDQEKLKEAADVSFGDKETLPFPHLFIWWKNGDMGTPSANTVRHHGGWAMNVDEMANAESMGKDLPSFFGQPQSFTNRSGENYRVFTARYLPVSLIAVRKAWFTKASGKPYSKFQALVYLADIVGQQQERHYYEPWGPAVLSSSGFSAKAVEEAFQGWAKEIRPSIREHAPKMPPWLFYGLLGTLTKKRQSEQVGSGNQTSPITPCQHRHVNDVTYSDLENWFIGRETMDTTLTLKDEAGEWLEAWDDIDEEDDEYEPQTSQEDNGSQSSQEGSGYTDFDDVGF